jgi:transposase
LRPNLHQHARGKPLALKAAAVLLYVSGLSINRTAKLLGVSTPTVQAWLEQFAAAYAQETGAGGPIGGDRAQRDVALSEKCPSRPGSGKLGIVLQGRWWTGTAAVVTRPPASA